MKKIYLYILFILFGIVLLFFYNNSETLSIGGSNLVSVQYSTVLFNNNSDISIFDNIIKLDINDETIIVDLDQQFNEIILSNDSTIIYLGLFKKLPNISLTGGMIWDTRYFFINLIGTDFYIIYCTLISGDINNDFFPSRFETKGEYKLDSNDANNILFEVGNIDGTEPDNYIRLYLDDTDQLNRNNILLLWDSNTDNIRNALLILTYLSNLCINRKDCNNRARQITGSRDTQCICTCDQPNIYTSNNCEIIQSCTREDCNNKGDPREGASRDENCGPCTCDETCSCLNESGVPYDESNCENSGISEVAPHSQEPPHIIPRINSNGLPCRWYTPDTLNCISSNTSSYLLIPGSNMRWGSGRTQADNNRNLAIWQTRIEQLFSQSFSQSNQLIDTTNNQWAIPEHYLIDAPIMDGYDKDDKQLNFRGLAKSAYGLYEQMYSKLQDIDDRSLTIYATSNGGAILFIILSKLYNEYSFLLQKVKSVVLFSPAFAAGSKNYFEPNKYNNYENFNYFDNTNFDFFDNINVVYILNEYGFGNVINQNLNTYIQSKPDKCFIAKIYATNHSGDIDLEWKDLVINSFHDPDIEEQTSIIQQLYNNIWMQIYEWSIFSTDKNKNNILKIENEIKSISKSLTFILMCAASLGTNKCIDLPTTSGEQWTDGKNDCDWYKRGEIVDETNLRCDKHGGSRFSGIIGNANKHCCACDGGIIL